MCGEQVEILLATYNGERFLRQQLDSLLDQTWENWHLTVSDDFSTDKTVRILETYIADYPDRITRVIPPKRFGNARDHFFWLMRQCGAEYILFCDQDDVWYPEKIGKTVSLLKNGAALYGNVMPLLAFTDQRVVRQDLSVIAESMMRYQGIDPAATDYRQLLFQNVVTGCTMGINQSLAQLARNIPDSSEAVMHDWWLALTASRFGKILYLNECTMDYRQHDSNSVGAKNVRSVWYLLYKLAHLRQFQKNVEDKKKQTRAFLRTFIRELEQEERIFLERYGAPCSPFFFKLSCLKWVRSTARKVGFMIRW